MGDSKVQSHRGHPPAGSPAAAGIPALSLAYNPNSRMWSYVPITKVEITPIQPTGESKTRALATVIVDNRFAVGPFRVVEGQKGLFVGYPQRKDREGQWHDIVRPLSAEARREMHETILGAYQRLVERPQRQDKEVRSLER